MLVAAEQDELLLLKNTSYVHFQAQSRERTDAQFAIAITADLAANPA
jgi:hypothetical protein